MARGRKTADDAKDGGDGGAREKKKERRAPERFSREWFLDWARTIVFAAIIFFVFRSFLLATFVITSGSMEDTLLIGDFLLVNRVALGSEVPVVDLRIPGYDEPEHGDIIVFRADHAPGLDIVKRTVGLPGDTISMRDGQLFRNGEVVPEPYAIRDPRVEDTSHPDMYWQTEYLHPSVEPSGYYPTRDNWGPLVIPEERFFMLGDNRDHSLDSRYWGLVERRKMKGRPLFIYYSY
ncbi:MAG: signal peptidase I, partial [Gemmatimonadota bacterium]|nr:signal peptidase I [Gemmatimonadota bacterium]